MSEATPGSTTETLDDVAPRLSECMGQVIAQLQSHGVVVGTVDTYLLDSSQHRLTVPCTLDGVLVQVGFSASLPAWSEGVRAHLLVCFAGSRRWSIYEGKKGFQVPRIVGRILKELESHKQALREAEEEARNRQASEDRLAALALALGVVLQTPSCAKGDNLEITAIPDKPAEVLITVRTSHASASRIAKEFRQIDWRRKKS
jgi:hypothetical protein